MMNGWQYANGTIDDVNEIFGTLTTPGLCDASLAIRASNDNMTVAALAA